MNARICVFIFTMVLTTSFANAQPANIASMFPQGTVFHQNISYANDTLKNHLLDIYLPPNQKPNTPLVVWIHGGAWNHNDKYADMGYMKKTVSGFIEKGYALASIDYRFSTQAIFPAQIQDCHQALEFLSRQSSKYNIDKNRIVLIGFSAGGHLASLMGLSLNNNVESFYPNKVKPSYRLKGVLDFYGPIDFLMIHGKADPEAKDDALSMLLGSSAIKNPAAARKASPSSYVDPDDPPFFIVHGEKDESVPYQQSVLLKSMLEQAGVRNELTVVKDAPHYGVMFDADDIRNKLFLFLESVFAK